MRLGITCSPPHENPRQWAHQLVELGCRACILPCDEASPPDVVEAYVTEAHAADLRIAEVGAWSNPMSLDPETSRQAISLCQKRLAFAERIGAACCPNISGAVVGAGGQWDGPYPANDAPETYERVVAVTREIIDAVQPTRTSFTLEPMPWMIPDSPEQYAQLLRDVDRPAFAVHLDVANWIHSPRRYFHYRAFVDACFSLLGPHIKSVHLKDVRLEPHLTTHLTECPCGEGGLDLPYCLQQCEALSHDLPVMLEHLPNYNAYIASLQTVIGWRNHASDSV